MASLEITQLSCVYDKTPVLSELDLQLQDNQIICLLGESGCGKTTLLKAVAGLQKAQQGCIKINGRIVSDEQQNLPPEKRKIGLIFQDYALFPHLNVFDNVAFSLTGLTKHEKKARVEQVLTLVQLADLASRFPHQLSGGQQQRIAIARALAYQPDLMLLDEPFSNLDQHVRFQLIHEIRALLKNHAMSALFVTHSKEEGFAFADKIALMQSGKIVQIGTAQDLYQQPQSRYVADFMGKANYLPVQIKDDHTLCSPLGELKSEFVLAQSTGEQCELLVRPEQLAIELDVNAPGCIEQIHFLGDHLKIQVRYEQLSFLVSVSNSLSGQQDLKVGDSVKLQVLSHCFVLFDGAKKA